MTQSRLFEKLDGITIRGAEWKYWHPPAKPDTPEIRRGGTKGQGDETKPADGETLNGKNETERAFRKTALQNAFWDWLRRLVP